MMLSDEVSRRLDRVWYRLNEYLVSRNTGISQIDADEKTVELLEAFVVSHTVTIPALETPRGWAQVEGNGFDDIDTKPE